MCVRARLCVFDGCVLDVLMNQLGSSWTVCSFFLDRDGACAGLFVNAGLYANV